MCTAVLLYSLPLLVPLLRLLLHHVFVFQAPPAPSGTINRGKVWAKRAGFHHKSHRGRRVNCLLWDSSGDRLFSVCSVGMVVMARNLLPRRAAPAAAPSGITGMVSLLRVGVFFLLLASQTWF